MDILNEIICNWSKDEIRQYKVYARRTNQTINNKSEKLFDYIRSSGESYDENRIFQKLYDGQNKNAFYRLKNNLLEDVTKNLLTSTHKENQVISCYHYLGLVQHFKSRNQFRVALYYLKKAEKSAEKSKHLSNLDQVYTEYIQLSNELIEIEPQQFIDKRRAIKQELDLIRKIDDLLIPFTYKLKRSQTFARSETSMEELEKIIHSFEKDSQIQKSYHLKARIYKAISSILLQKQAYVELAQFAKQNFETFEKEGLFNKENHDFKLEMLIYIVNASFKNNQLASSLKWAGILHENMKAFNRLYYKKYQHFYYSALMYNYSELDIDKAIELAIYLQKETWIKNSGIYEVFIQANLGTFYYIKKEYRKAIKVLTELYTTSKFIASDAGFKLKLYISELIIWHDMNKFDTLEYRLHQIKKEFAEMLADSSTQEHKILEILDLSTQSSDVRIQKQLKSLTNSFIHSEEENKDGTINYINWIKNTFKM